MKYDVSEVAKILQTKKDIIKTWAYHFKDYLSDSASPSKGTKRIFTIDDIIVLQYIAFYWEDNPDFENIEIGLNRGEHQQPPFNEIAKEIMPVFKEFTENDTDEDSVLVGGMMGVSSLFQLAQAYKYTGDIITKKAIKNSEQNELLFPIVFNYRHAIELYLKSIFPIHKQNHNLSNLLLEFKALIKERFNTDIPIWLTDLINTFNDFDSKSTTFRYGNNLPEEEILIDIFLLKKKMEWVAESFYLINNKMNGK